MIDTALAEYANGGPFDVVICDSVVNSIDTNQAEADVLTCLSSMCKLGGTIFYSGRSREHFDKAFDRTRAVRSGNITREEFFDQDGFSGYFRKGEWFFQKFHRREDVLKMNPLYFGDSPRYIRAGGNHAWQSWATKKIELPIADVEASLRREFDLPWPNNNRVGRSEQAVSAWQSALSKASAAAQA